MKTIKIIPILFFLLLVNFKALSQLDPLYNLHLTNQSMINPAYIGVHDVASAMLITRGQWVGIEGAPITHTLSLSSSITKRMGVGFTLVKDAYGINNNLESVFAYSYQIKWFENTLSFGIQASRTLYQNDYSKLQSQFADDPNIPDGEQEFSTTNFGTGVFFAGKNFYLGASIPRIRKVNLFDGDPVSTRHKRHFYLSAGYLLDVIDFFKIKPSMLLRVVEGESISLDLNGQVIISDKLWLGISVRNLDGMGFNVQFIENVAFRLGYSFELPIGPLASSSYGVHELMFSFDARLFNRQRVRIRYF